MTREDLNIYHQQLCDKARDLMQRKNQDYGADSDPFRNFRMSKLAGIDPALGIILRMQDKMARLISFAEKGGLAVKEESWTDSVVDIINYSILLAGLLGEKANLQIASETNTEQKARELSAKELAVSKILN